MSFKDIKKTTLIVFASLFFIASGFADSVFLKDRTEMKGDILKKDSEEVLIEYFVTPTIKDQKTIPLDQIMRIVAIAPDQKAFQKLGNLVPPKTVLDTSFYDPLVDRKLPDFLSEYPYSSHTTVVREALRTLKEERERVRAGGRCFDGVWMTPSQIASDPYQIGARVQFEKMSKSASLNDPIATLKAYELFEKGYAGSSLMPDALDLAIAQMSKLQGKISAAQVYCEWETKRRQTWIALLPPDEAKEVMDSIDRETQNAKVIIAKVAKDGSKFFPIFPNVKESLDALQGLVVSENTRLKTLAAISMRKSLSETSNAAKSIESGNFKYATMQLDDAAKLWPENVEIATLKQKIENTIKGKPTPSPLH